jgi:DsbC/DsbD-like thiol-disulfide interchange protein
VAETSTLQRGRTGWLAVHLTMKPGWHTYWRNSGDSGLATSVKWTLPQGVTAGPIVWPQPERFVARTIVGYGYQHDIGLLTAVKLPPKFAADRISIGGVVSWLACEKVCIPGSEKLTITLPVSDAVPVTDPGNAALFAQTRRRIPQRAPFDATFSLDAAQIRLSIPRTALPGGVEREMTFYPFDNAVIEHSAPQAVVLRPRQIDLMLSRSAIANDQIPTLDGLLIVKGPRTGDVRALDVSARKRSVAPDAKQTR